MPGLVPGIRVFTTGGEKDVDGRDEPGHDGKHRVAARLKSGSPFSSNRKPLVNGHSGIKWHWSAPDDSEQTMLRWMTLFLIAIFAIGTAAAESPGAAKTADDAKSRLGKMRYRQFARPGQGPASGAREAQLMIGHPSNSGLQMDQVTQLYVPAFFVNELRLWQDDSLVLTMEGGISISEDPNIRFTYVSNGAKNFRAEAKDTEGHVFQREWKIDDSGT